MKEEFYKQVIQNSPIGYAYHKIICDSNGKPFDYEYIEVNSTFEKYTGLRSEEIIGKRISEILPEIFDSKFDWIQAYGRIALNGGSEEYNQYSEGLDRWYRIQVYSPEKYYFITNFIDITKDMRNIEENKTIINAINDIIFELDMDYNFIKVISSNEDILFLPVEEIMNKKIYDIFPQETVELFTVAFEKALFSGKKESVTYKLSIQEIVKWFEAKIKYIDIFNKGKYIVSVSDISEKKLLAEKLGSSERILWKVMDTVPNRIFWKDLNLKYLGCNENFAKDIGLSCPKDIVGKKDYQTSWKEFADIYQKQDEYIIETGRSMINLNQRMINSDGEVRWIKISKMPLYDNNKNIYGIIGTYEDITEQRKAEELLKESQLRYEQLAEISHSVAWEVDNNGIYTYISPTCERVFGYKPEEIIGKMFIYNLCIEEDREEVMEFGLSIIKQNYILSNYEYRIKDKNNKIVWLWSNGFPILDDQGKILAFRGIDIDITYLKEMEEKVRYLSFYDQLTGIYNRSFFEEELKRLDTERNLPLSLAMININELKIVNDGFGYNIGDKILKKVSQIIKENCRGDDIVARIDGNKFVILLPKTNTYDALGILKRINNAVSKENIETINLSISYSCNTKRQKHEIIEDVLKMAEKNIYEFNR